jgi:rod shape-determining protein MreD
MKKLAFILLIVLCFLIESRFTIFGTRLNFTVLFAYYIGLRHGAVKGTAFGAALGLAADSVSGNILGPNILGKGTVGYLSSFLTGSMFTWTPFLGFLAVLALTVADGAISFISMSVFSYQPAGPLALLSALLMPAILNSLAGPLLRPEHER